MTPGELGFDIGDIIQVEWEGIWMAAQVLELDGKGNVKIQYLGWDESWNEFVPIERTRVPTDEDPSAASLDGLKEKWIKVLLTSQATVSGVFLGVSDEHVVLRSAEKRRIFINKQQILYLESES